jgi:hypothetical protein
MDETYFSRAYRLGDRPGKPGLATHERTVFGMVERGGKVVARHVPTSQSVDLEPHIKEHVLPGSMVFTDYAWGVLRRPKDGLPA